MAKATFALSNLSFDENTLEIGFDVTRTGACGVGGDGVTEVDFEVSLDGSTWYQKGSYGCSQIGTSATPLNGGPLTDQNMLGATIHVRLNVRYGDDSHDTTTAVTTFAVPYRPIFPEAPATRITEAWETQKEDFASDYVSADDGSGNIASVGSPPVPRYVQTYDEALEV